MSRNLRFTPTDSQVFCPLLNQWNVLIGLNQTNPGKFLELGMKPAFPEADESQKQRNGTLCLVVSSPVNTVTVCRGGGGTGLP